MLYYEIENLLKETMGLDAASIGSSAINRAIHRCITDHGFNDAKSYLQALKGSPEEMAALIEAVVVPETWFFRDKVPFDVVSDYIKKRAKESGLDETVKILSIPCSTGEEPYSIAMVIDGLGLNMPNIKIDAVDISSKAISFARKGLYRENSFRTEDVSFREKYFVKSNKDYLLGEIIRDKVSFYQGNLLAESLPIQTAIYDCIFCRNLLIYFDRDDQTKVIKKLHKMLAPEGVLFVGHAEPNQNFNEWFEPLKYRGAFAYRKLNRKSLSIVGEETKNNKRKSIVSATKVGASSAVKQVVNRNRPRNTESTPPEKVTNIPAKNSLNLDEIIELADKGELKQAAQLCEEYISANNDSAEGYYLRGLIQEAIGEYLLSIDSLKKAVYLNPNHHEALTHLSLCLERSGDKKNAAAYGNRAKRAENKGRK